MKTLVAIKQKHIFTLLIFLIWTQSILLQYVRAVLMRLPIIGAYPDAVLTIFFATIILLSISFYKITQEDMLFLAAVVLIFILDYTVYQSNREFLAPYFIKFLLKALPLYVVGVSFAYQKDKETIIRQLYILSIITLIIDIVYKYTFGTPMSAVESLYQGDMDKAYKLLPHCCLIAYYAIKHISFVNVVCTVVGVFYLLMLGSRGPALIYLAFIAFVFIRGRTTKGAVLRAVALFGLIVGFVASPLYNATIVGMYNITKSMGLSVRIFDKLLSGVALNSSGRDVIRENLLSAINNNPFLGHGICSDRVFAGGSYAHNIVLELWTDFGIIIGSIIFVFLVIVLLRGYLSSQGEAEKGLILSLIFASFLKLFLSGSFLDERLLFFLLGICVCNTRKKIKNQKSLKVICWNEQ